MAARAFSSGHTDAEHPHTYHPHKRLSNGSNLASAAMFEALYNRSLADPENFWRAMTAELLTFDHPYDRVKTGSFASGDVAWFTGGTLNASVNCIDRHLDTRGDTTAIHWEGDSPGDMKNISYRELFGQVCRFSNMLRDAGVRKGDRVAIYMPMVPEAVYAMLACARIGAPHSVVFAGFSADSLRDRILDADCRVVITADEGLRAGKRIPLKATVDTALRECPRVHSVFVHRRTGASVPWTAARDHYLDEMTPKYRPYAAPELMDSEDPLFILYTSGSTGKPKGLQHSTAGYLLHAALSHKYVFDTRPSDVYACVADIGWITGHTYVVYGPLANGGSTVLFESTPLFPDASRYWEMVERLKVSTFYTSPTAIRSLVKHGDEPVRRHDLSSLRVLGTVGEPINPAAWRWLYNVVGRGRCAIVDTYWQTETGGIVATPIPSVSAMKPGSCARPFFGIEMAVVDPETGAEIPHKHGESISGLLAIKRPWPGMARTIWRDHARFMKTYFSDAAGFFMTGDGVTMDETGYLWITGRVDDVIKVSGHRLGSAAIESALVANARVAEAAVIGAPHELKGEGVFAFVTLKDAAKSAPHAETRAALVADVRKAIGPLATPEAVIITDELPKTRSGKIMRRLLRKQATGVTDLAALGDISTLAEPRVVETLRAEVPAQLKASLKSSTNSK
eukprot:a177732_7.p2 GENE.a177732_7~~a177732_7.p2  ORF type:complete len:718 (+),score=256.91 a177732_7:115-2154(+)